MSCRFANALAAQSTGTIGGSPQLREEGPESSSLGQQRSGGRDPELERQAVYFSGPISAAVTGRPVCDKPVQCLVPPCRQGSCAAAEYCVAEY